MTPSGEIPSDCVDSLQSPMAWTEITRVKSLRDELRSAVDRTAEEWSVIVPPAVVRETSRCDRS
jgi:hypothetical protein